MSELKLSDLTGMHVVLWLSDSSEQSGSVLEIDGAAQSDFTAEEIDGVLRSATLTVLLKSGSKITVKGEQITQWHLIRDGDHDESQGV